MFIAILLYHEGYERVFINSTSNEMLFETIEKAKLQATKKLRAYPDGQALVIDVDKQKVVASAGEPQPPITWKDLS